MCPLLLHAMLLISLILTTHFLSPPSSRQRNRGEARLMTCPRLHSEEVWESELDPRGCSGRTAGRGRDGQEAGLELRASVPPALARSRQSPSAGGSPSCSPPQELSAAFWVSPPFVTEVPSPHTPGTCKRLKCPAFQSWTRAPEKHRLSYLV